MLEISIQRHSMRYGNLIVSVNGVRVGEAPLVLRVLPGSYDVVANAAGSQTLLQASVVMPAGSRRHLVFAPQGPRIASDPDNPFWP